MRPISTAPVAFFAKLQASLCHSSTEVAIEEIIIKMNGGITNIFFMLIRHHV